MVPGSLHGLLEGAALNGLAQACCCWGWGAFWLSASLCVKVAGYFLGPQHIEFDPVQIASICNGLTNDDSAAGMSVFDSINNFIF